MQSQVEILIPFGVMGDDNYDYALLLVAPTLTIVRHLTLNEKKPQ